MTRKQTVTQFRMALKRDGESVVLRWVTYTGGTVDPTTGAVEGGTSQAQNETVKGFIHVLDEGGKTKMKEYGGFEQVDVMVELLPEVVIEGRADLLVELRGGKYVQARLGHTANVQGPAGEPYVKQVEYYRGAMLYRTLYLMKVP